MPEPGTCTILLVAAVDPNPKRQRGTDRPPSLTLRVSVLGDALGRARANEPPMPEPLAYFLTWSTYGTWLPGDERGWIEYRHGWQLPDPIRKLEAQVRMTEDACRLDHEQRAVVERQIAETCH